MVEYQKSLAWFGISGRLKYCRATQREINENIKQFTVKWNNNCMKVYYYLSRTMVYDELYGGLVGI